MQNHLVFFSFWRSLYVITFTMNTCATSITLNILITFRNRLIANFTGKLILLPFFTLNTKAKIERGRIAEIKTRKI